MKLTKLQKIILISILTLFCLILFSKTTFGERINFKDLPSFIKDRILAAIRLVIPGFGEEIRTYELLIKKVQTGTGKGAAQGGDIIMIKPAGYQWSSGEIQNFWIVTMELTESQVQKLLQPKEIDTGKKDERGEPIKELEAKRKYYLDPEILKQTPAKAILTEEAIGER